MCYRIWLLDLSQTAAVSMPCGQGSRHFHGFDISSQQFPTSSIANVTFSVHDLFKPFLRQHLGRYDLVHVRLLVLVVKREDIMRVLKKHYTAT
jgi:hypothetical protein